MGIADYINLMSDSRDSALNLWGFLLTASIAIVGYLSSIEAPSKRKSILFGILFLAFAASNFEALKINYESRAAAVEVMELKAESKPKFKSEYNRNEPLIETLETQCYTCNLGFQVGISLAVFIGILTHGM